MNELGPVPEEAPGEREATVDGTTYRLGDTVVLRLEGRSDPYDRILDGRSATVERIYLDYDDRLYFGCHRGRRSRTAADARHGPVPLLLRRRARATEGDMTERSPQILVAGVGNAWMQDDGFGGEVVRQLKRAAAA